MQSLSSTRYIQLTTLTHTGLGDTQQGAACVPGVGGGSQGGGHPAHVYLQPTHCHHISLDGGAVLPPLLRPHPQVPTPQLSPHGPQTQAHLPAHGGTLNPFHYLHQE